jgi:hypothetical protein
MAVIRRVTPANPISTFPATVRPGPSIFDVLADGMAGFADHFDGLAREQARRDGAEMGAAAAGSYMPSNPGAAPPGMPRQGSYTPPSAGPTIDNPISPYRGPGTPGSNVLSISGALDGVDEGLVGAAQQAWGYVMPPGSRIEVSTGVSSHSPRNHAPGRAIDFRVVRPDGSTVMWDDPEAVRAAQFGRALGVGGFGAGPTYMGGSHFHWDINNPRTWSDDDGGASDRGPGAATWGMQLAEAEQLGVEGLLRQAGVQPPVTSGAGIAVASRSDSGGAGDIRRYADAIASVESRGSGDYQAVGPETRTGNRAYGRYQVMDFNVGPWTEEVLGVRMTPEQFLADEAAQDAVFEAKFGQALAQYGNPQDAASVWFSGQPLAGNSRNDGFIDVPEYVQRFNAALGEGGTPTMSAMNGEVMPPQTAIRNEQGQIEMRPLDIFTSEYDIIRQNAALGTYAAGVLNNASLALSDLRRQFPLDPDGFRQAAQGYVSRMMENAPAPIREQLLSDLQLEAGRTLNGILAARQENTMARARAEIGARIETTALEYSTLLAQGDTEGAAVARANLESALRYRETLPGSTWGPEQTNMLLAGAERDAVAIRERTTTARNSEIGSMMSDIRREAGNGQRSVHESIMDSPEAQAHPEYGATRAAMEFRDFMGGTFPMMSPQERRAFIEEQRGAAVDDYSRNFLGAMESAHTGLLELERTDPVAAAGARGFAIAPLDPSDPQTFIQGLMQRRAMAEAMVAQGFADPENARIFSNAERDAIGEMIGEGADPETREQIASALILTQGENVVAAMRELGAEESVAQLADVARATSNARLLSEGLQGSALRAAGMARPGTINDMMDVPEVASIMLEGMGALPANMRATVLEMSLDILAYRTQGAQEVTDAQRVEAVQAALGRMSTGGYGGVQDVFGGTTLIPPTMTPRQVESAFQSRFAAFVEEGENGEVVVFDAPPPRQAARTGDDRTPIGTYASREEAMASLWEDMPQGVPMFGGQPMTPGALGRMQIVPVTRSGEVRVGLYTMQVTDRNGVVREVEDSDGNVYVFDVNRMAR